MYEVSARYSENIAGTVTFTGISGTVTLNDGTTAEISDEVIGEGQLSILYKMNSGGEFGAGGVYPAELSMTLQNFEGSTKNLDGAEIVLAFRLYTDSSFTEYDEVPLGVFDVDGSTIKRRAQRVSLKALDRLVQFDRAAEEKTGTLYELLCYACDVCGVPIEITQTEFEALPNADMSVTLNTARVQTWRDFLGYVGAVTSSFARATRTGGLRFCPIACNKTDGGVIIPVREISGDVRFSTEFSDDTTRVTKLIMRRNGSELRSTTKWTTTAESRAYITLELPENPLFAGLSDEETVTALNAALSPVANCLNRTFKASFNGDPALDIGDYVRLRGGDIDTSRGYGTGMITSMTWKYHGSSTIECNMPSSVASSGASAAGIETDSDGRVQPKSQIEKRLDELEAEIQNAGGLPAPITMSVTDDSSASGYGDDVRGFVIKDARGLHKISVVKNDISIRVGNNSLQLREDGLVATMVPSYNPQGTYAMLTLKPDGTFQVIMTHKSGIQTAIDMDRTRFDIRLIYGDGSGENRLDFNGEGLFINHKRVLTEE